MEFKEGTILEGTVKRITSFGVFVTLPENNFGMVHISEVSYAYVNDIHDHVKIGQTIKVKIMPPVASGKIELSIKRAVEPIQEGKPVPRRHQKPPKTRSKSSTQATWANLENKDHKNGKKSFDSMLKDYIKESEKTLYTLNESVSRKNRR